MGLILAAGALTAQTDTTARDSTARDTTPLRLPVFPAAVPAAPLPPGGRWVFDADSLRLSGCFTLADVLAAVPGAYVARGGFFGQAENVFYGGRGPSALEVFWDGVPYLPLGRDSLYLDAARVPLAPLERVEVQRLPGVLRIYLVTVRQASTAASSSVGVVTGDRNIARYVGQFARRWRSGMGLSLVADWSALDGSPGTSSTGFNDVDLWVNVELARSERFGISYQQLSSTWERDPATGLVTAWHVKRNDASLRMFVAPRGLPQGPRFEVAVASTAADGDTAVARRAAGQVVISGQQQWHRASVGTTLRLGDGRRPLELEAQGAWATAAGVTFAVDLQRARYRGGRVGTRAIASAGVRLPLGFALRADGAWSRDVQAPVLSSDAPQQTTDLAAALLWNRRWISLELGTGRRDAFAPAGVPAGLLPLVDLHATPATRYLTAHGSVRPFPWLAVSGWYFDPVDGGGDFEPPYHARAALSFFSRFLRTFPSGIFALRGDVRLESWSAWSAGVGPNGTALDLTGATFVDLHVAMQIGDVTAFWTMRNANGTRASYVPQLEYPQGLQVFGVRWDFTN